MREYSRISEWHEPAVLMGSVSGERHRFRYYVASLYAEIGKAGPEWWEKVWRGMAARVWPWGQPDRRDDEPEDGWPEMINWW